jgi:hypothetical protein
MSSNVIEFGEARARSLGLKIASLSPNTAKAALCGHIIFVADDLSREERRKWIAWGVDRWLERGEP